MKAPRIMKIQKVLKDTFTVKALHRYFSRYKTWLVSKSNLLIIGSHSGLRSPKHEAKNRGLFVVVFLDLWWTVHREPICTNILQYVLLENTDNALQADLEILFFVLIYEPSKMEEPNFELNLWLEFDGQTLTPFRPENFKLTPWENYPAMTVDKDWHSEVMKLSPK